MRLERQRDPGVYVQEQRKMDSDLSYVCESLTRTEPGKLGLLSSFYLTFN